MTRRDIEQIRFAYRDYRPWLVVTRYGVTDWNTRADAREWSRLTRHLEGPARIVRL